MTPTEAQHHLGLSDAAMARVAGVHYMTWRKWVSDGPDHRDAPAVARRWMSAAVWMHHHAPDVFQRMMEDIADAS